MSTKATKPKKIAEKAELREKALELLRSPELFDRYYAALTNCGLVGEERNSGILLVTAVSRLLDRPLNVLVKGQSSAGKNHLVSRSLRLLPKSAVIEISSSSEAAWNYAADDFCHKIVYIQERNEAFGSVHQARLMISEGCLRRTVTVMEGRVRTTKTFVAKGPIAAISTTTKSQLAIDDETRHISIRVDESAEQTGRIVQASSVELTPLSSDELKVWHKAHRLLEARAKTPITLPEWFTRLALLVDNSDIRARRYYPAFTTACRAVALLSSFQKYRELESKELGRIEVTFEDFAIAWTLFERAIAESLHRNNEAFETRIVVERLGKRKKGLPVSASEFATESGISRDKAYTRLREAVESGAIHQANKPEKGNLKLFLPTPRKQFIPDPDKVFDQIAEVGDSARYINPLTGEWVDYSRPRKRKAG